MLGNVTIVHMYIRIRYIVQVYEFHTISRRMLQKLYTPSDMAVNYFTAITQNYER